MKIQLTLAGLVVATALTVFLNPAASHKQLPPTGHKPAPTAPLAPVGERPRIEVVFALDTTGSMGGLIQGAKDTIWSIATTLAQGQPTPEIRMGLVAFRDRGDTYVTRRVDLSDDLDSLYSALMDLEAGGGGDGPESVNQALYDAVHHMSWSQDTSSYRVVFLVGDAPGHTDYAEVQYPSILADAMDKGIRINTILCGENHLAASMWQQIAQLGQGDYHQVSQSGGVVAITSPFDDQIATLAAKLDATRIFFGDADELAMGDAKRVASAKLNAKAPAAVLARRAEFNASAAGSANLYGAGELVDAVTSGRVKLEEVETEALPETLKELSSEDRLAYVQKAATERTELKQQLDALNARRKDHVARERAARPASEAAFDASVAATATAQAAEKGLRYEPPETPEKP